MVWSRRESRLHRGHRPPAVPRTHHREKQDAPSSARKSAGSYLGYQLFVLAARSAAIVFKESCSSVSTCLATTR